MEPTKEPSYQKPVFPMWQGLSLVAQISGYIVGPLIVIGGFGYWLDQKAGSPRWIFIIAMIIAFIASNALVYKKAHDFSKRYR